MGDIIKKVTFCGIDAKGNPTKCHTVEALIDTGATQTIISNALNQKLTGIQIPMTVRIEDREIKQRLAAVDLDAPGCRPNVVAAAVDDALVRRAGTNKKGEPLQAILGHDYLQRERGALRYAPRGAADVACHVEPLKIKKRGSRSRR